MASLVPVQAGNNITAGLTEYLATSFSLADKTTAEDLAAFLQDPEHGIFHGPYVRTRLPYAPAKEWEGILDYLPEWFAPYHHQAAAFRRLTSLNHQPEPTLVVTGTGSGKTESFLYPILDHVRRARKDGQRGIKALILYPMNALANDQASRLARLIAEDSEFTNVTAGLYTGESGNNGSKKVTAATLITDRRTMQDDPPDILLTNYKMLDQLLLRPADQKMWELSASTLQYLVLDEFHTYDGAQGTDVALLLRRLGLKLHQAGRIDPRPAETETDNVLFGITPIATSATLGDKSDIQPICDFAETIFGVPFSTDSVVTERQLDIPQWQRRMRELYASGQLDLDESDENPRRLSTRRLPITDPFSTNELLEINGAINKALEDGENYVDTVYRIIARRMITPLMADPGDVPASELNFATVLVATAHHASIVSILNATQQARPLTGRLKETIDPIVSTVFPPAALRQYGEVLLAEALTHLLTFIATLRSRLGENNSLMGKQFPGVETHLWVREVSRIDRAVDYGADPDEHRFRFSDDGPVSSGSALNWLPACYCRTCGRSGWMATLEPGTDNNLETTPSKVRTTAHAHPERQRPLLDATMEQRDAIKRDRSIAGPTSSDSVSAVHWFDPNNRLLEMRDPDDDDERAETMVPVLTYFGSQADEDALLSRCPSCGEQDAIRFLGSRVPTLLSVALSNLFGMPQLDSAEKKTLIFADSVQDAAHRAGFVQNRSRAFTLRMLTRREVGDTEIPLSHLAPALMKSAQDDPRRRYELLPPGLARLSGFQPYWDDTADQGQRDAADSRVAQRLSLDLDLEFGDRADLPRSLVLTGSLTVGVKADKQQLLACASAALEGLTQTIDHDQTSERTLLAWAQGILELVRINGGINNPLLEKYIASSGNSYLLHTIEAQREGTPTFARGGAPEFPMKGRLTHGQRDYGGVSITSAQGRYARWTSRLLGYSTHDSAIAVTTLFENLAERGIFTTVETPAHNIMFALEPHQVVVGTYDAGTQPAALVCNICHGRLAVNPYIHELLTGAPCHTTQCTGHFISESIDDNYYRRLYSTTTPRTVVAAEHTALIPAPERLKLEEAFRSSDSDAADSPNVLVATPTLEMGIDIGDLSTVMLASLPTTVASYVQRVGRAGRLSGNSLIIALIQGRGKTLPKLNEPLSVINGSVTPPSAFLNARDILHRQFIAHLLDTTTILEDHPGIHNASEVFAPNPADRSHGNLIDSIVAYINDGIDTKVDHFLAALEGSITDDVATELRQWATTGPDGICGDLTRAQARWIKERATLLQRVTQLEETMTALNQQIAKGIADDSLKREQKTCQAALGFARKQLRETITDEFWVSALERYGLLPNFTLLDDSVKLEIGIAELSIDTAKFDVERREYRRGISIALQEFAPGATFYAQGIQAKIDRVDVGNEGENIQNWRVCPSCSYAETPAREHSSTCPRCKSATFKDGGQIIPVIPMTSVFAEVDRTRSSISDINEDRRRTFFHLSMTADIDPSIGSKWFNQAGFGAHYLPKVNVSWLNLGIGEGETRMIAGQETSAALFRACKHCGHIDSEAGSNQRWDHAAWCPHRQAAEEDSVQFALGRSLSTQGVVLYIPPLIASGDTMALPSLIAALRLGFRERLGGDPAHLDIVPVRVEGTNEKAVDALLLHDTVPGGTGYLTQFADAPAVWELLYAAWQRVQHCDCENDDRQCCPECLLPYTASRQIDSVSRASAALSLHRLLTAENHPDPDTQPEQENWEVGDTRPEDSDESELELRFKTMFRTALADRRYEMKEGVIAGRSTLDFAMPNQSGQWHLREQESKGYTQPDFYLRHDNTSYRDIAIYLDGARYHAHPDCNRVKDDLIKRSKLHEENILPWTLTWADLDLFEVESDPTKAVNETSLTQNQRAFHTSQTKAHQISSAKHLTIFKNALSQLLDIIDYMSENDSDQLLAKLSESALKYEMATANSRGNLTRRPVTVSDFTERFRYAPQMMRTSQAEGALVEATIHHFLKLYYLNGRLGLELLALPPDNRGGNFSTQEQYTDAWQRLLNLSNFAWLSERLIGVIARDSSADMVADDSRRVQIDIPEINSDEISSTPDIDDDAPDTQVPEQWSAANEEYGDDDEISPIVTALIEQKAPAPDGIGDEISGFPTLMSWLQGKMALVEDQDLKTEFMQNVSDWHALSIDDELDEIIAAIKHSDSNANGGLG